MTEVISVRFRGGCKNYYFDPRGEQVRMGDQVIVETAQGPEFATCTEGNHEVEDHAIVKPLSPMLRMATENGYRLMGEDGGRLEAGRKADLITIKMLQPHLYPTGNTVNTLLECVTAGDVCDSIVNGKLLMKDRKVLTLDEEKILAEAAEYMDREMKKTGEDTAAERKKVS